MKQHIVYVVKGEPEPYQRAGRIMTRLLAAGVAFVTGQTAFVLWQADGLFAFMGLVMFLVVTLPCIIVVLVGDV